MAVIHFSQFGTVWPKQPDNYIDPTLLNRQVKKLACLERDSVRMAFTAFQLSLNGFFGS
jgi:hypothetical protein